MMALSCQNFEFVDMLEADKCIYIALDGVDELKDIKEQQNKCTTVSNQISLKRK